MKKANVDINPFGKLNETDEQPDTGQLFLSPGEE